MLCACTCRRLLQLQVLLMCRPPGGQVGGWRRLRGTRPRSALVSRPCVTLVVFLFWKQMNQKQIPMPADVHLHEQVTFALVRAQRQTFLAGVRTILFQFGSFSKTSPRFWQRPRGIHLLFWNHNKIPLIESVFVMESLNHACLFPEQLSTLEKWNNPQRLDSNQESGGQVSTSGTFPDI